MNDSCPSCCTRDIPPAATAHRGDRLVDGYRCPDCGRQWATTRDLPSYSDLSARPVPARPAAHPTCRKEVAR